MERRILLSRREAALPGRMRRCTTCHPAMTRPFGLLTPRYAKRIRRQGPTFRSPVGRSMAEKRIAGVRLARGRYKSVRGEYYGTPKEVWGFRAARAAPTSPEQAARTFLATNTELFELEPASPRTARCPRVCSRRPSATRSATAKTGGGLVFDPNPVSATWNAAGRRRRWKGYFGGGGSGRCRRTRA